MQIIILDTLDNQSYDTIYIKQNNKGFTIKVEITKNRKPFNLTGYTATLEMVKPDKSKIQKPCSIVDDIIHLEIDEDMTDACGKAEFQIVLVNGDIVITTVTAIMKIEKSAIN